jgi:F-type H+-transporting ATPase subunit alpha
MTDAAFNIDPEDVTAAIRKRLQGYKPELRTAQVGRVIEVGDGIARVAGLPGTSVNELLRFEGNVLGIALNLDEDSIGAVVLGQVDDIEEGGAVESTGQILSIPVGEIGRASCRERV